MRRRNHGWSRHVSRNRLPGFSREVKEGKRPFRRQRAVKHRRNEPLTEGSRSAKSSGAISPDKNSVITVNTLPDIGVLSPDANEKMPVEGFVQKEEIHDRAESETRGCDRLPSDEAVCSEHTAQDDLIEQRIAEIGAYSIEDLWLDARTNHVLQALEVHSVEDLLWLSPQRLSKSREAGAKTREQIEAIKAGILIDGESYIAKRKREVIDRIIQQRSLHGEETKGFDFPVIDDLIERFFFKTSEMSAWFDLSQQSIHLILNARSPYRWDVWTGKEFTQTDKDILHTLIRERKLSYEENGVICRCLNNRKDDFVYIYIGPVEIRCYYLQDLPEELREKVEEANLHRYSEKELAGEADGSIVHILKKPYLLPNHPEKFRINAQLRGLEPDEYAEFLYGCPSIDGSSITDDQIVSFLRQNEIEGKVHISSDPDNQWICSFARRHGYGIKDFVEFYGFEYFREDTKLRTEETRKQHIEDLKQYVVGGNIVYLPTDSQTFRRLKTYAVNKGISVNDYIESLGYRRVLERKRKRGKTSVDPDEKDMQIYSADGKAIERLFAKNPLLGSRILKQETITELNNLSRRYIDQTLQNPDEKLTMTAKMQITLALISNAKDWDYENNSRFWNYIALRFGYRDTTGAVVRMLQSAMEDALKANGRLFVEDWNGRAFKSTAVIHAFAPKRSWSAVFDFLFDFYKENLNWKILPGDPILESMMETLQKKLSESGSDESEAKISISSGVYSFQEGVRKLILLRPAYTRSLFERLLLRIDANVHSVQKAPKTYEEQLCDEWYRNKVSSIAAAVRRDPPATIHQQNTAFDYSHIRARYFLSRETEIHLAFPEIRLAGEDRGDAVLSIYYGEECVLKRILPWYGNELGRTLKETDIPLPDLKENFSEIPARVRIAVGDREIYDSGAALHRRLLVFSGEGEIALSQIHRGGYTLAVPMALNVEIEGASSTGVEGFRTGAIKAVFAQLGENFLITLNGEPLAFDAENHAGIHVILPQESHSLPSALKEEEDYTLAWRGSACSIVLHNSELQRQYILIQNGRQYRFEDLSWSHTRQQLICHCTLHEDQSTGICRLQILNIGNERLVYDQRFLLVESAEFTFDRPFYYDESDYAKATLSVSMNAETQDIPFSPGEELISVSVHGFELRVTVPVIQIEETTGGWLDRKTPAWFLGEIPQESLLKVSVPEKVWIQFTADGQVLPYDGEGIVTIGTLLHSMSSSQNDKPFTLEMTAGRGSHSRRYVLARIYRKEQFLSSPELWADNGRLYWNHGGYFVGRKDRFFTVRLVDEAGSESPFRFRFTADIDYVPLPEDIQFGEYHFQMTMSSGKVFGKRVEQTVSEGCCMIGDQNHLRFWNRQIAIQCLTDEKNEEAGRIFLSPCYIDQIAFTGIEDTSEGMCPVYQGELFTMENGVRRTFSHKMRRYTDGSGLIRVNPVRIVYISDDILSITDADGDGLYYYQHYDRERKRIAYSLTDQEYTKENRHKYSIGDLYIYQTE